MIPTTKKAEEYLVWAGQKNPGLWTEHSKVVARAARIIAEKVEGLDSEKAYVLGLLHDIGRYVGVTSIKHIYDGFQLMIADGYDEVAQICITHSFPIQNFETYAGGNNDCTENETSIIKEFLNNAVYTDYDRLIQLCDSLSLPAGICLMEKRLMDVVMRYGVKEHTVEYWKKMFEIKNYFAEKINTKSFYDLFPESIQITFAN
jgi:putative nucleotidyltransferase with HDIG domain